MPSPFPGMDPYIEQPDRWIEFHNNLAGEIQERLNQELPSGYYAALEPVVTYDVVAVTALPQPRAIRPDVAVQRPTRIGERLPSPSVRIAPAPARSTVPLELALELLNVEVRAVAGEQLVTAIEILSPVNKRPGHDAYTSYRRKRSELLRSLVHLLEIDLLRSGERPPLLMPVPPAPYYVVLSRAEERPTVEVWPIQLSDPLPVVPVPLLARDPDVLLDLSAAVAAVYERNGYARRFDYREPLSPPLSDAEQRWLDEHLRARGLR